MRNYVSPVIFDNDELTEGVYASGSGTSETCWTIDYTVPQKWNGQAKVFEIKCEHSKSVWHESKGTVIYLMFNSPVVSAYAENSTDYKVEVSGSIVKIERDLFADAFNSGDKVTFKLFVSASSQSSTELLDIMNKSISCIHN